VNARQRNRLSRNWTRPGARGILAAALALSVLALPGCGGRDSPTNIIKPLLATAVLDPDPGGSPFIYLVKISETGDLVIFEVRLRTSIPIDFTAFNFEAHYDRSLVTVAGRLDDGMVVGGVSYIGALFCACDLSDATCPDTNPAIVRTLHCLASERLNPLTGLTEFLLGVTVLTGDPFPVDGDVRLLTIGFRAAAPTPPGGTRVDIISDPAAPDGSCEILDGDVVDLGVPCATGFVLTAQR
jgi:hypothetical protein